MNEKIKRYYIKFRKFRMRYFSKTCNAEYFNQTLRMEGISVGKGTIFYSPETMVIDRQRPWMLIIGEYCKITAGCTILTHDYSRSVLRRAYHDIVGEAGMTVIGNNVFIGMHSIILMGTHIGDNVIVGAGSVVSGNIPSNVVIAGNPARVIRSLNEHYNRRKSRYIDEAKLFARSYYQRYGKTPSVSDMTAFFPLFFKRDKQELERFHISLHWNGDEPAEILEDFLNTEPVYSSYEEFLEDAMKGGIGYGKENQA